MSIESRCLRFSRSSGAQCVIPTYEHPSPNSYADYQELGFTVICEFSSRVEHRNPRGGDLACFISIVQPNLRANIFAIIIVVSSY